MNILQEIKVPQESVNDEFISVVDIIFNDNDFVEEGDILIELETSKAVFTIESEVTGYVKYFCKNEDEVAVNSTIVKIYDKIEEEIQLSENKSNHQDINHTIKQFTETIFSEKASQYIAKNNIDKTQFTNLDFVNTNDIFSILGINKSEKTIVNENKKNVLSEKIDESKVILQKLSKNKKREIEYLKAVQKENLNSTVNINIETSNIFVKINPHLKYFKNSLLPIIIYEISRLLKKYPELNSFFVNNQIAIYNEINIGLAIDMDLGLKTVKIPNTISKTIKDIDKTIFELSNKYIDNKLQITDLSDITFTITDLSSEGVDVFIPLINKNNAAILGVSANDKKLNRTTLSLTFDHRITTGKKATILLRELKERIESYKHLNDNEIDTSIKCFKCMKSLKDDFNDVGFLKTTIKNGEEKYICQTCFTGF